MYERQNLPYGNSNVPLSDALLLAGYMHPLLSDGGKNAFVYGGAPRWPGYESLTAAVCVARRCGATRPFAHSRGGGLHLRVELFLSDHLLFVFGGRGCSSSARTCILSTYYLGRFRINL